MILPTKHSGFHRSLIFVGGKILSILNEPKTVSRIWDDLKNDNSRDVTYLTYEWFILSIDFLYLLDIIELRQGLVRMKINHDL